MKIHELKLLSQYYSAVELGLKNFEIRKNDRDYHMGDRLILNEWDGEKYSGRKVVREVRYIIYGPCYGLTKGHCIMALKECEEDE